MWVKNSPFYTKQRRWRSTNARNQPTTLHFNTTSFNLESKQVFPKLGLGNYWNWRGEEMEKMEMNLPMDSLWFWSKKSRCKKKLGLANFYFSFSFPPFQFFSLRIKWNEDEMKRRVELGVMWASGLNPSPNPIGKVAKISQTPNISKIILKKTANAILEPMEVVSSSNSAICRK